VAKNEAVRLEERSNVRRIPAHDVFQDWHEHTKGIVTQDRPRGDRRNEFVLRDRDGKTVETIHVQHDVHIRAAVADVYDPVVADEQAGTQFIEEGHLPVTGAYADDGLDFAARLIVPELRSKNVIVRNDSFERGLNHFLRSGGEHIEREPVTLDAIE